MQPNDSTNASPFRKIIVASDGSEYSTGAIRVGVGLARRLKTGLAGLSIALYSPEFSTLAPNLGTDAAARAEEAIDGIAAESGGYPIERIVQDASDPADGIVAAAAETGADLIVMGRRGRRGLARMMVGHATVNVIGRARTKVLVVPKAAQLFRHRIVLATDGSAHGAAASAAAGEVARSLGLPVTVVSVLVTSHSEGRQREGEQAVASTVEELRRSGVDAEGRIERGLAEEGITRAAESVGADLVVMGSHGRTGLKRLLLGSVSERVIGQVGCSLLIVKP